MVKFVIVSTARSGSTFLWTALDRVPGVKCWGECFSYSLRYVPKEKKNVFMFFLSFVLGNPHGFFALPDEARRRLTESYLRLLFAARPGIRAVGFKLMYDQAALFPHAAPWLERNGVRVIHLIRKNLLKRLLSFLILRQTGVGRSTRPVAQVRVRLRCDGLVSLLGDMEAQVDRERTFFSARFCCLEMFYEDLIGYRRRESERIEAFLGLDRVGVLSSDLVKVNSDEVRDIVENYEEVALALQGTRFARFLET